MIRSGSGSLPSATRGLVGSIDVRRSDLETDALLIDQVVSARDTAQVDKASPLEANPDGGATTFLSPVRGKYQERRVQRKASKQALSSHREHEEAKDLS